MTKYSRERNIGVFNNHNEILNAIPTVCNTSAPLNILIVPLIHNYFLYIKWKIYFYSTTQNILHQCITFVSSLDQSDIFYICKFSHIQISFTYPFFLVFGSQMVFIILGYPLANKTKQTHKKYAPNKATNKSLFRHFLYCDSSLGIQIKLNFIYI